MQIGTTSHTLRCSFVQTNKHHYFGSGALQHTDWVHVAPVLFLLRMFQRISVDLAGTREQEPGSHTLREAQHVEGTDHIGLVQQESRT